ncbi:50S ribosomal protein L22 [Nanobdella aerobiophila]|uniref:50S ribosomal protein L22 n=1 Tax=Nanobdella aerobiophila TaxID=2586965 RepID=A0A915SG54_9ARCH|nr:50S ribosomal protein L22 [Nanobdella aerobiophila]BBL45899.1 50S ribosomal protein L22 [Nanobdella aerobiophila]
MNSKIVSLLKENKKIVTFKATNVPISRKDSEEVGRFIKYLPIPRAKKLLEDVLSFRLAIPYYRYNKKQPHHKNVSGKVKYGRYPIKTIKYYLKFLSSLENNAKVLGLDPSKVIIVSVEPSKGNKYPARLRVTKYKTGEGGIKRVLISVRKKVSHIKIYALYIESIDTTKKLKKKALKNIVKEIIKEWQQKI